MRTLISLYAKRLSRQKLIYFFLFAFAFAVSAYAFLITTPEMYEMLNVDPSIISGARFPEFMLRFYSGTVGAVFMTIITALYINEEISNRMFAQPLLHGKTRLQIIHAKLITLCAASFCMIACVFIINYIISAVKWGLQPFQMPAFGHVFFKYFLTAISLTVLEEGVILISLYAKRTLIAIAASITCIFLSSAFNENIPHIASIISFDFYPYYWVLEKEYIPIPMSSALTGTTLALVYGVVFYLLIRRRSLHMDFTG